MNEEGIPKYIYIPLDCVQSAFEKYQLQCNTNLFSPITPFYVVFGNDVKN